MKREREGDIEIAVPDQWRLLKYDDTLFYQGPVKKLGVDRTAVDFVAASPDELLVLLELKDFRQHAVANRKRLIPGSGDLAAEVVGKVWDTLGALYAGCRAGYHAELRPFAPTLGHYPPTIHAVLLLEEDPLPQPGPGGHLSTFRKLERDNALKLRGDLLNRLQNRLKPFRIDAFLFDCQSVPARAGWTATARLAVEPRQWR